MSRTLCQTKHPLESAYACQLVHDHDGEHYADVYILGRPDKLIWTPFHGAIPPAATTIHGVDGAGVQWAIGYTNTMVYLATPAGCVAEPFIHLDDPRDRAAQIIVTTSDRDQHAEHQVAWDVEWASCRDCKDGNDYDCWDEKVRPCLMCGGLTVVPVINQTTAA